MPCKYVVFLNSAWENIRHDRGTFSDITPERRAMVHASLAETWSFSRILKGIFQIVLSDRRMSFTIRSDHSAGALPRRRAHRDQLQHCRADNQITRHHKKKQPIRGQRWRRQSLGDYCNRAHHGEAQRRRPLCLAEAYARAHCCRLAQQRNRCPHAVELSGQNPERPRLSAYFGCSRRTKLATRPPPNLAISLLSVSARIEDQAPFLLRNRRKPSPRSTAPNSTQ